MVPTQEARAARPDAPAIAVPRQRGSSEQERILADDRLIEAIRSDRITEDEPVDRLVRLLVRWRRQVRAGT